MSKTVSLINYRREIISVEVLTNLESFKDTIDVADMLLQAKTGDVVLFDGKSFISEMIKLFTWSDCSHIGMIVHIPTDDEALKRERLGWMHLEGVADSVRQRAAELFLLHATDFTELPSYFHPYESRVDGVQLTPLYAYLKAYKGTCIWRRRCTSNLSSSEEDPIAFLKKPLPNASFYPVNATFLMADAQIKLRSGGGADRHVLNRASTCLADRTLFSLIVAVCVAQYEIETWRLLCVTFPRLQLKFIETYRDGDYQSFFCSDLVALVYQALGWIKVTVAHTDSTTKAAAVPEMFAPHAFAVLTQKDQIRLFGQVILQDCIKRITFS